MESGLRLRLAPSVPDDDGIHIYITPDVAEDLKAELEAQGYTTSWALEHALGLQDLIIAVTAFGAAGGFRGLAAVLNAFFAKNQHRSMTLRTGELETTLSGMSKSEMNEAMEKHFELVQEHQRSLDESWHRIQKETQDSGIADEADKP